jgi:hypothetical protein
VGVVALFSFPKQTTNTKQVKENRKESLKMTLQAPTIPLLSPYKMGNFNLCHRFAIFTLNLV